MESLISAFGIDIKLIIVQIINFVVLAGALSYLLYKPLLKVLEDRETKIKQGVRDADKAKEALKNAEEKERSILSEANKEAEEKIKNAKALADDKANEIIKTAEVKASEVLKNAEVRGIEIEAQIRKESEAEIAKVAILAAEKILKESNR